MLPVGRLASQQGGMKSAGRWQTQQAYLLLCLAVDTSMSPEAVLIL